MEWNHWHPDGWMGLGWVLAIAGILIVLWLVVGAFRRSSAARESPDRSLEHLSVNGEPGPEAYERNARRPENVALVHQPDDHGWRRERRHADRRGPLLRW